MPSLIWGLLACIMLLMAAGIAVRDFSRYRTSQRIDEQFAKFIKVGQRRQSASSWLTSKLVRWVSGYKANDEIATLLFRAGWGNKSALNLVKLLVGIAPVVLALTVLLLSALAGHRFFDIAVQVFFAFALTYVSIRQVLRYLANRKHKQIREELIPFLHLIKMLFASGLSLEHALKVISLQSKVLTPCLAVHLERVISNINSGQDQAEALNQLARSLDVDEFTEAVAMLCQMARYGGNIKSSLDQYITTIEHRYFQELREYLNKLSAKMSIVMVLFMFPALMIFIAGPGFIGLAKALSGQ